MKIDRSGLPVKQIPDKSRADEMPGATAAGDPKDAARLRSEDAIQISSQARDLQAQLEAARIEKRPVGEGAARAENADADAAQRLAEIRGKLETGFYETQEITALVAGRMLHALGFGDGTDDVSRAKDA